LPDNDFGLIIKAHYFTGFYWDIMAPTIRPALESDISDFSRLYVEFHQFHVRGVPDRLVSLEEMEPLQLIALADNLRCILGDSHACILVADVEGCIQGFVEAYDRRSEPHPLRVPRRFLYIQSLYVRKESRRLRLGQTLLKAACAWGKKRGLKEIQLEAWDFPGGPQRFYEFMGFSTLRRTMVSSINLEGRDYGP
jgi:GNAT superfamily N-acetyltransferase